MSLPPIAPFPPASFRRGIVPEEWEACLGAWITLAEAHLKLSDSKFFSSSVIETSLSPFLISYFSELSRGASDSQSSKDATLKRIAFLLTHRLLSSSEPPKIFLQCTFLGNLSHVFVKSAALHKLLQNLWNRRHMAIQFSVVSLRQNLTETLETHRKRKLINKEDLLEKLKILAPLCHTLPDVGEAVMTGSDFLDAASAGYAQFSQDLRTGLLNLIYIAFLSLTRGGKPNISLLSDHLYTLKSDADKPNQSKQPSLLSDLVTRTPFVARLQAIPTQDATRLRGLIPSLSAYGQPGQNKPKKFVRRKIDKGKGAAGDEYGHGAFENEVHVHRMSLIAQVQELFPDLGAGFVVKLLDEYSDNVEQVTAHLLDDSLPEHLKAADRHESLDAPAGQEPVDLAPHLAPRSTPPLLPQRHNVFDNDEFDQLTVNTSKLHIGRKNEKLTADTMLSDQSTAPNKAAILSALAAFDSDDDERDDTYDMEDVGGTVDAPGEDIDIDLRDKNDEALFRAWKMSTDVFKRDADTKRSKAREALRSETGMTDETIEGWALMLSRDPRRLKRLEARFSAFDGQQRELVPTSYRAGSGTEESDVDGATRGRGGFRGRGRGRGRGGRGGTVAGPADEKGTQQARQRKEASKGSRANHNRRDQRARKMARGGFPG